MLAEKTLCFTGHRIIAGAHYAAVCDSLEREIDKYISKGYTHFISGGAMGFDLVCGETIVLLKEKFPDIKLIMVLPFVNQAKRFPIDWKQRYDFVLSAADEVDYYHEKYVKNCFIARNARMVAYSSMMITYYNGKPGGTANTIAMAQRDRLAIVNLHTVTKKRYEKLNYFIGYKK